MHPEAQMQATRNAAADEIELARRACGGDVEAFGLLVKQHMKRAYVVAYRLMRNREDAEDLVQESFVAAFVKLETFEAGRSFAPWFFRILVRRGFNAQKARRVREASTLEDVHATPLASPETAAERDQMRQRIRSALDRLPPRQRLLVELVELEGFTPTEVAHMVDISPATARWHLHAARGALKPILSEFAA